MGCWIKHYIMVQQNEFSLSCLVNLNQDVVLLVRIDSMQCSRIGHCALADSILISLITTDRDDYTLCQELGQGEGGEINEKWTMDNYQLLLSIIHSLRLPIIPRDNA